MVTAKERAAAERARARQVRNINQLAGQQLKAAREAAGKPARALAEALGITLSSQFRREAGDSGLTLADVMLYAEALGCPALDLVPVLPT